MGLVHLAVLQPTVSFLDPTPTAQMGPLILSSLGAASEQVQAMNSTFHGYMVLPLTAHNCSIGPNFDQRQANPVYETEIPLIFHKRNILLPILVAINCVLQLCGRTTGQVGDVEVV